MKPSNATIRPGRVLEVLDNQGTIRVSAPGLFSKEDQDKLPPVMHAPWGGHANAFTTPNVNDEVWVMNFIDNPRQLYWFRKDPFAENNKELQGETNVEIICNRESGLGYATLFFSDDSGWIIRNDDSKVQIDPDGNITLKMLNAHRCIQINPDGISIGSEGSSKYHATYAEPLESILQKINITLKALTKAAQASPYTANIGAALEAIGTDWSKDIPNIESVHVTID